MFGRRQVVAVDEIVKPLNGKFALDFVEDVRASLRELLRDNSISLSKLNDEEKQTLLNQVVVSAQESWRKADLEQAEIISSKPRNTWLQSTNGSRSD